MSEIIERNKTFLVKSQFGSYTFNNRQSAEQLNIILTDYESLQHDDTITDYETKIMHLRQQVIQLQMTFTILQDELNKIKKELGI